jgi:hypothetical protein
MSEDFIAGGRMTSVQDAAWTDVQSCLLFSQLPSSKTKISECNWDVHFAAARMREEVEGQWVEEDGLRGKRM